MTFDDTPNMMVNKKNGSSGSSTSLKDEESGDSVDDKMLSASLRTKPFIVLVA
jgi:hypothetical protein